MPGCHGLRERGQEHGAVAAGELEEPGQAVAAEAEEPVRIVLQDGGSVRPGHLDEPVAVRLGERATARVLERGDRVDEARPGRRGKRTFERVDVEPVIRERDRLDVGAQAPQDLQRAVVAGRLDEDLRTGLDVVAGDEAERLQRPVRDHHARDVDVVTVGDPLP